MIETEAQLEDALASPNAADIELMRRLPGDVIILGAGGKMGPSLARRIRNSTKAAGVSRRVLAVSRFSSPQSRDELESTGIETISCDLLDRGQVESLPDSDNVFFLAGRKFGSSERSDLTWAINSYTPGMVAERFRGSRIVVFSTGNIYPQVKAASRGSIETDIPMPVGEYAQSCLGRERVFEYFSRHLSTPTLIFRLNYAVDLRYGVLVDIAQKVHAGKPVDLSVPTFNVIWQGDANSYAMRSLELCQSPARILNVTGPETLSVCDAAAFFGQRFNCKPLFSGEESGYALLSDASLCHSLLGYPTITSETLMESVAHWVRSGGVSLGLPTKFEVTDGRY